MELGYDGVAMNTAIAAAHHPILMASAMKKRLKPDVKPIWWVVCHVKRMANASSPEICYFFK